MRSDGRQHAYAWAVPWSVVHADLAGSELARADSARSIWDDTRRDLSTREETSACRVETMPKLLLKCGRGPLASGALASGERAQQLSMLAAT